jgi:Fe-S cluster assembly iron-binding protein IscA
MSGYAMPYRDLGIDVDRGIAKAGIAQYIVDMGTRPSDNTVVSLSYKSSVGAFVYHRSIAKKTWGTDDPAVIASKLGPGWDRFFTAAADLKKKGFCIVSGGGDILPAVENSAEKGWIVDGKLYIDPKRETFLDYSKELVQKGYTHGNSVFSEDWRKDISGAGESKVFGFLMSSWMINNEIIRNGGDKKGWAVCKPPMGSVWGTASRWVLANKILENDPDKKAAAAKLIEWMTLDCTEKGLQYYIANGTLPGCGGLKYTVSSRTVMEMSDGTMDILGGQDMFGVYIPASQMINGRTITEYDETINSRWRIQAEKYAHGECTRGEAITAFKQEVKEKLGIDAW